MSDYTFVHSPSCFVPDRSVFPREQIPVTTAFRIERELASATANEKRLSTIACRYWDLIEAGR